MEYQQILGILFPLTTQVFIQFMSLCMQHGSVYGISELHPLKNILICALHASEEVSYTATSWFVLLHFFAIFNFVQKGFYTDGICSAILGITKTNLWPFHSHHFYRKISWR